jgi:hypothetical protein
MKIALCLHGLFNSIQNPNSNGKDGYDYIKKHIISKFDTDVYVHSWEPNLKKQIDDLYKPKISEYESLPDFSTIVNERKLNTLVKTPRSPASVLSHLCGVSKSISLLKKTNIKYDIVIKSRFDLGRINRETSGPGFANPYPVQCINLLNSIHEDRIYMANWNHFHMGPADMWFYGSPNIMEYFENLYSSLLNQMFLDSEFHKFAINIEGNPGDLSNAIAFYKWWMINNRLWDKRVTLDTIWE